MLGTEIPLMFGSFLIIHANGSIPRSNSRQDSGSPWRIPLVILYALKHSLPAIRGKRKRTECLGPLTKRYWSAGGALTKRNNAPSRTGLGKLNLSQKPQLFPILSGPTQPLKRY